MTADRKQALRLRKIIKEAFALRKLLAEEGPILVATLNKKESLGKIAKRSRLSKTYLSMVLNRKQIISPQSFLALLELEPE